MTQARSSFTHWRVSLPGGQALAITAAPHGDTPAWRTLLDTITQRPPQATVMKNDPASSVVWQTVVDGRTVVVKNSVNRGAWKVLRRCWRTSRARNAWKVSQLLRDAGVDTPAPLAFVERRLGPLVLESWFVCESIDGADTLLDVWKRREPRREELQYIGTLFRALKQLSMSHGDMKATNFLVAGDRIFVIDFDGARRHTSGVMLQRGLQRDRARFLRNWQQPAWHEVLQQTIDAAIG